MIWWIVGVVSYLLGAYATVGLLIRAEGLSYDVHLVAAMTAAMLWPCFLVVVVIDEVNDWDWRRAIYGWVLPEVNDE